MHLSEIWIYPVKSLGGIRLTEAVPEERGLQYDRRWLIVDQNNKFITQRIFTKMALIDVQLSSEGLVIFNRENPDKKLIVPFEPVTRQELSVTVWDDTVTALTVTDEADQWLTEQLGQPLRLVYMPQSSHRQIDPKYAKDDQSVSFADAFPFLFISQESLDDLNTRLEAPVAMKRFRPNIVIKGATPFAEDEWSKVQIGSTTFELVKLCARCVLVTVNPETAEKGAEPLKTLSQYRRVNNKVMFGKDGLLVTGNRIKEGDPVTLL